MRKTAFVLRLFLVIALVASTQGLLFVQGAFLLRQEYVASMLCVNRFNPESDCNGTCYLRKQMEAHHGSEHEHGDHGKAPALLELALSTRGVQMREVDLDDRSVEDSLPFLLQDDRVPRDYGVSGVFHPPRIG